MLKWDSEIEVSIKERILKKRSGNFGKSIRVTVKAVVGKSNGFFSKNYKENKFNVLLKKYGLYLKNCYEKKTSYELFFGYGCGSD